MSEIGAHVWSNLIFLAGAIFNGIVYGLAPFLFVALALLPTKWVTSLRGVYFQILAFSSIGAFLGMFTGASKEPVVAAMLPATITLISGLTVYFFEKKQDQRKDLDISALSALLCGLVIFASFGAYYAANLRALSQRSEAEQVAKNDAAKLENNEIAIKLNRAKLCREMFVDDAEMKGACVELLKPSK